MDLDAALARYLAQPDVARWLFSADPVHSVTAEALDRAFVYSIGFGATVLDEHGKPMPRVMDIEDMLVLCGTPGHFAVGVVWGLSQTHVFARTPLMLGKKPLARRFAVDLSQKDCLEFMEFVLFDDGVAVVMFRQFLHTEDGSLPVLSCARMHASTGPGFALGPVLMTANVFEAASCPQCYLPASACQCSFGSRSPCTAIQVTTHSWSHFVGRFSRKGRSGTVLLTMSANMPQLGMVEIVNNEVPVVNVLQQGNSEYMNLMRRKAVHALGVTVIMPRGDTHLAAARIEQDYLDLHNGYVQRKRGLDARDEIPALSSASASASANLYELLSLLPEPGEGQVVSDSVGDILSFSPGILNPPELMPAQNGVVDLSIPLQSMPDLSWSPAAAIISPVAKETVRPYEIVAASDDKPSPTDSFNDSASTAPDAGVLQAMVNDVLALHGDARNSPESVVQVAPSLADVHQALLVAGYSTPSLSTVESEALCGNDVPGLGAVEEQTVFSSNPIITASSAEMRHFTGTTVPLPFEMEPTAQSQQNETLQQKSQSRKRAKKQRSTSSGDNESEKKHACTSCSSRFKMRGDLQRHIRTGKRPIVFHVFNC